MHLPTRVQSPFILLYLLLVSLGRILYFMLDKLILLKQLFCWFKKKRRKFLWIYADILIPLHTISFSKAGCLPSMCTFHFFHPWKFNSTEIQKEFHAHHVPLWNFWITESSRKDEVRRDFWKYLVQPLCSSRASWSRVPSTLSSQPLNINKGGDYTTFLGNMFKCLTSLIVEEISLCLNKKSYISVCAHSFLSFHRTWLQRAWLSICHCYPYHQVFIHTDEASLILLFLRPKKSWGFPDSPHTTSTLNSPSSL